MLLRSSSTPLLKNLVAQCHVVPEIDGSPTSSMYSHVSPTSSKYSHVSPKFSPRQAAVLPPPLKRTSSEGDLKLLPKAGKPKQTKEISRSTSSSSSTSHYSQLRPPLPLQRASSEGDLKPTAKYVKGMSALEDAARSVIAAVKEEDEEEEEGAEVTLGGGGGGEGGFPVDGDGKIWGSGGGGETELMDKYYRDMIIMYPGDELLLSNYAKFLKDVRGDGARAEEYCERAILVNAGDGSVLSMYGDLIWNNHKDGGRANSYFNQAVKSSPDDCNVLASYAKFLWDVEEEAEEEEEEEEEDDQQFQKLAGVGSRMQQIHQQQPRLAIGFGSGLGFPPLAATT
ncbi:hypothetical protein LINPERHAP1_LOCUS32205 [Linum perenne]